MSMFGDPRAPRRNLWGGLVLTALGALMMGMTIEHLDGPEQWPGAVRSDWISLALEALMVVSGVMQFRLGLRATHFPSDSSGKAR